MLLVPAAAFCRIAPRVSLDVYVVDEQGEAVVDASVSVVFPARIASKGKQFSKLSDQSGSARFSGRSLLSLPVIVQKEGYYISSQDVWTMDKKGKKYVYSDRQVTIVLREITNPVEMLYYRFKNKIGVSNEPRGFDLVANDWVSPWGKGSVSDIIFNIKGYYNSYEDRDSTMDMLFSGDNNGIVSYKPHNQSGFKSPYIAPSSGYVKEISFRKKLEVSSDPTGKTSRETIDRINDSEVERSYMFRIRSISDDQGEVISALYGKIYGTIDYGGARKQGTFISGFEVYVNISSESQSLEQKLERNGSTFFWDNYRVFEGTIQ